MTRTDDDSNLAHPIPRGCICRLDGSTLVQAWPDNRIGKAWSGLYRVRAVGDVAWTLDVTRDRLAILSFEELQANGGAS